MAFLLPFVPEHLARIHVKHDAVDIAARPEVEANLSRVGAKTLLNDDGTVLGILGVFPSVPGVGEVFILASEEQKRFPVTFARHVRKELRHIASKFRRIQAITENDAFHARWITWLGFEREGILKRYGLGGQDMVMWSLPV